MSDVPREASTVWPSAPPPDGLGSYKGVMLCNRPTDEGPRHAFDSNLPPFKSTINTNEREQLGLVPTKKMEPRDTVKMRGPSAALRRHMQWIKDLQREVADEQKRIVDDDEHRANRKERMQVKFKQQRDAVRELKYRQGDDVDARELVKLMNGTKAKKAAKKTDRKPLWAMTEEEKADVEDEEAAALIDFAENLDFEKYCGDAEFRNCLKVIEDRAKKLQKEQDRFKDDIIRDFNAQVEDDDEYGSAYTGSPRSSQIGDTLSALGDQPGRTGAIRRSDRPDWDSSTTCGDDRPPEKDKDTRSDAGRVLDARPQLKGIHSKESVQRIIEKTRGSTPQDA